MHNLLARPWDVDGPITARSIARLLIAFNIQPRVQRIGSDTLARGCRLEDFMPHWEAHLDFDPAQVTDNHQSEIANNDKGCYAVTHSRAVSVSEAQNPDATPKANGKAQKQITHLLNSVLLRVNSQLNRFWLLSFNLLNAECYSKIGR